MDLTTDTAIALATLATVGRIFAVIAISILSGWLLGYASVRNRRFEKVYVSLVNVAESIPVIGFLPLVVTALVVTIPGRMGIELAVDFLVFDAVAWNLWIGAYQAFKTVPASLLGVIDNYRLTTYSRIRYLFIPHSIPRVTANVFSSFADGFFYVTVSEVFTAGVVTSKVCPSGTCSTFGIGTEIDGFLAAGNYVDVFYCLIAIAIAAISITMLLSRVSRWATAKYGVDTPGLVKRHVFWARHGRHLLGRLQSLEEGTAGRIMPHHSRQTTEKKQKESTEDVATGRENGPSALARVWKSLTVGMALAVLGYLAYSAFKLAAAVPVPTWLPM